MSAVAMQSFGFDDQLVRVVDRQGAAWFVANDVCGALEIANPRNATARLDADERDDVRTMDAIGREQKTTIISESGVYALVFTSRKEAAKRFRRWVTQDVLPTLRRTGRYAIANDAPVGFVTPETPDEFDMLRARLALVKEARIAFGPKAARKAWAIAGLPDLTEPQADSLLAVGVIADLNRSVADWLDARTAWVPGHRAWARDLYDDYLTWATAQGLDDDAIVEMVIFGKVLSQCGVPSGRSNRVYRMGLRLID